ncbi:MAG: transaldolase [Anaerolineaceae bacterium]|nr:transaldolase [Anaerolineaceae bacterium]
MTDQVPPSVIEDLANTGGGLEIWWDSSPLIFKPWVEEVVGQACGCSKEQLRTQLQRLYREDCPEQSVFVGCTTNPPLSWQAIQKDRPRWDAWVKAEHKANPDMNQAELFWHTYRAVIKAGAQAFHPVFEKSNYKLGYISGQVDPRILTDTETMVAQGVALNEEFDNVMIKMPGTKEGVEGIEELTARGIPTNATLTFALSQLTAVPQAVLRGLKRARENNVDLSKWRSVVTMMLGRLEDHPIFEAQCKEAGIDLTVEKKRLAGLAVFKKAVRLFKERGYESKMLAASMRLGPTIDGREKVWHLEHLAGGNVVLTVFPNVFEGLLAGYDAGELKPHIDDTVPQEVIDELFKTEYFRQAYEEDGLKPEEWISYPPVVATGTQFANATDEMEAYVGEMMKG